jgi:hypothetical protein
VFEETLRKGLPALAFLLALAIANASPACETSDDPNGPWEKSVERDASGKALARFIPPELYTGAAWQGERELILRPVDVTRKPLIPADHPAITFKGPMPWQDDPSLQVIRRYRESRREGAVLQYFAVNERSDGLGRVSDERRARSRPAMAECFKFPLGAWKNGESRTCRDSTIQILEIDFVFECMPHALKFRWNDEGTYVFAPDRGLVAITH